MAFKSETLVWMLVIVSFFFLVFNNIKTHQTPKLIYLTNDYKLNMAQDSEDNLDKRWTLLMTVNDGYFDFFQNWIHFYKKLHLNYKLIVIAEDDIVFFKLQQLAGNIMFTVVRSQRSSLSEAVAYGSKAFRELASGRPSYILKYLKNGVNIVYADTDAVWLKDPFPYFNGTFDMWMQSDGPNLCTGLVALKSNNKTINLMQNWEASLRKKLQFNQIAFKKVFTNSKVHVNKLDGNLFPSGKLFFRKFKDDQRKNVVIVHNNYIKGHPAKLQRFQKYKLWFPR